MSKQFLKDAVGWGISLWLIGYVLGMVLFFFVPVGLIGWVILPIGTYITIWVLRKKIKGDSFLYYLWMAIIWVFVAVVFDYVFLVRALKPEDGYYKLDVYIYYLLIFLLPLLVFSFNHRKVNGYKGDENSMPKSL